MVISPWKHWMINALQDYLWKANINHVVSALSFQRKRIRAADRVIQTRGNMHVAEDEKEKEEVEVGSEGKARAGAPPLPPSQPVLSPKLWGLLGEAGRKTEAVPHPAEPKNKKRNECRERKLLLLCCIVEDAMRTGGLLRLKGLLKLLGKKKKDILRILFYCNSLAFIKVNLQLESKATLQKCVWFYLYHGQSIQKIG